MIRQATEDDVAEILALLGGLADYERLTDEFVVGPEDLRRELFGPDPAARVSLAETPEGSVAGMALWFPTFSSFLGRRGIWLEDLYVREELRGQGYGRELIEHLRTRADGRVEWAVLDWNEPSIAFYQSLGARPVDGWTTYRWAPPT